MLQGWFVFVVSLAYLGGLFLIASRGDRLAAHGRTMTGRASIYVFSLAVYCTSWTFFGSVGLAATTGYDFLPVYLGPILMFTLFWPVLDKILRISKVQNITSIADFVAARYGKSEGIAALVTLIAVVGGIPYIALQLKAVATNFNLLIEYPEVLVPVSSNQYPWWADTALIVTCMMALFAMLFGTRRIDATEHHEGMVLAIAFESAVKLAAFIAVGVFVTFLMFEGPGALLESVRNHPRAAEVLAGGPDPWSWLAITLVAFAATICLPRQFHVMVVENTDVDHLRRARWLFPLYLVAINIFVVPVAMAGLIYFPPGEVLGDTFVLALPMAAQAETLALVAFLGGLSAATGMVIVATVALSTMICNDLVVPMLIRRGNFLANDPDGPSETLLAIRRLAIIGLLVCAFLYYRWLGQGYALAAIGLLSFAAVAQFAPALLIGLYWEGGNRTGATAGILVGFLLWAYTLMMPTLVDAGLLPAALLADGPFGIGWLRPQSLLFDVEGSPFVHGVIWSLGANLVAFVAGSLMARPRAVDTAQAHLFVHALDTRSTARRAAGTITVEELKTLAAPFVGNRRVSQVFARLSRDEGYEIADNRPADVGLIRQTERLLAGVVGAASARLLMALSLERSRMNVKEALSLLDDASAAIKYNRSLLQSTLENISQGIAVFDNDLGLIAHNQRFMEMQSLPPDLGRVGTNLRDIIRHVASQGEYGVGDNESDIDTIYAERVAGYLSGRDYMYQRIRPDGTVIEVRTRPLPGTGVVATYTDITDRVAAEQALREANESLERRVDERTRELKLANDALREAKAEAEAANRSKTQFLAAASHDLMQPLNAARLFLSALGQQTLDGESGALVNRTEASLTAVDDLLSALLDIAKLDARAVPPNIQNFAVADLFGPLRLEFAALAGRVGLDLRVVPSSLVLRSDPKMLRRVLQNFLSNAVRYTPSGRILMGARRRGDRVRIEVWDTGPGIPENKLGEIFKEFHRLDGVLGREQGLGRGLAIVDRIARALEHPVGVRPAGQRGTVFHIEVPRADVAAVRKAAPAPALRPHRELGGRRVLCIDNEPAILDGMAALLGRWKCEVRTARGLSEAVDRLKGWPVPDIVLADYHLDGGVTGIDAIQAVRAALGLSLPAVLVTADRTEEVRAAALGFDCLLLNKPVRPAALRAVMMRAIAEARASGRGPERSALSADAEARASGGGDPLRSAGE